MNVSSWAAQICRLAFCAAQAERTRQLTLGELDPVLALAAFFRKTQLPAETVEALLKVCQAAYRHKLFGDHT